MELDVFLCGTVRHNQDERQPSDDTASAGVSSNNCTTMNMPVSLFYFGASSDVYAALVSVSSTEGSIDILLRR